MPTVLPCRRGLRLFVVLAGLALGSVPSLFPAVVTDLVAKAPEAKWYRSLSSAGELPWNGPDNDSRGFARHLANVALENGKTFLSVLETHPEWKSGGMIYGVYANVQVPAQARFAAVVGFLKNATTTDGATFRSSSSTRRPGPSCSSPPSPPKPTASSTSSRPTSAPMPERP